LAVLKFLQAKKYEHDQILYVDNAKSVIEYFNSIGLCRTVFVEEEYGIGASTCAQIENMFDAATLEKQSSNTDQVEKVNALTAINE